MIEKISYSRESVVPHNKRDDCWVIINNKIINLTSVISYHPGGDQPILSVCGRDATEDFEDAGHPKSAYTKLDHLVVATLDDQEVIK